MDVNYSLIAAVRKGKIEITRELINSLGLSKSRKRAEGYALLCEAVKNKNAAVVQLLITSGAKVNYEKINSNNTPLYLACKNGDIDIVKMLLDVGAYVNVSNVKGDAPLHIAVENGYKGVVTLLLSRGAKVDFFGKDGITPLHIAAKKGYTHIAKDLLKHGACTHFFTWKEGYTPLHFASELGNEEAVELFLIKGADANASKNSNLTPLHIATITGRKIVVQLLLQHGAKVDNHDKDGKTTLYLAVEKGYFTIVEEVLRYCPDINDQSNRSSLKFAVHRYGENYKKIVEALLEYGFVVNPEDANNPELLKDAVIKGTLKIIEDLLKYGADVHARHEGFTPLHIAAQYNQEEVAKLLISCGAEINALDKSGTTPIFYAIVNADLKMTNLLLTNRASIKDLLNLAVMQECIEIVEALLQYGADINAIDKSGKTALHFTALSEYRDRDINIKGEIAKLLLSKGARVDAETRNGETTLSAAIKKKFVKVVEALLKYNANVNSRDKSYNTPLHLSAERGNDEICTMLLNKGANVNAKQKDGTTALHLATEKGHKEVVKVLLERGAKVDSKMINGFTPLHLVSKKYPKKNYQEIIKTLLEFGANIDSRDEFGRTALHIAIVERQETVVNILLDYGSDINLSSKTVGSPLDHAMVEITVYGSDDELRNFSDDSDTCCNLFSSQRIVETLKCQIVKMKTANLYLSEENLLECDEVSYFQDECEEEIARMKNKMINNNNISFYDILAKCTSSLAIYMRNENIVQVLKSGDYETFFPIYASMIKSHFRMALERKELLEQGNKTSHFLFNIFPKLSYDCTVKIFNYLSNKDLRILIVACKPLHQ